MHNLFKRQQGHARTAQTTRWEAKGSFLITETAYEARTYNAPQMALLLQKRICQAVPRARNWAESFRLHPPLSLPSPLPEVEAFCLAAKNCNNTSQRHSAKEFAAGGWELLQSSTQYGMHHHRVFPLQQHRVYTIFNGHYGWSQGYTHFAEPGRVASSVLAGELICKPSRLMVKSPSTKVPVLVLQRKNRGLGLGRGRAKIRYRSAAPYKFYYVANAAQYMRTEVLFEDRTYTTYVVFFSSGTAIGSGLLRFIVTIPNFILVTGATKMSSASNLLSDYNTKARRCSSISVNKFIFSRWV